MYAVGFVDAGSTWHRASRELFSRAAEPNSSVQLVTATLTVDEVVFILLQELAARPPYGVGRNRSQYLAEHPDAVREMMRVVEAPLADLVELLTLEPVVPADVLGMQAVMATTGLLPRDALHVAVMRRVGLSTLVSDDTAFDRCAGITRLAP